MEMHQTLGKDKLEKVCDVTDSSLQRSEDYLELRVTYDQFLKNCNMVDLTDVLDMVRKELAHNEDLRKDMQARNYVLINKPQSPIEVRLSITLLSDNSIILNFLNRNYF